MKFPHKKTIILFIMMITFILSSAVFFLINVLPIGTGYVSKYICSSFFISKRDPERVFKDDIWPVNPIAKFISFKINNKKKFVTAHMYGHFESRAVFRPGCGCVLIRETSEEELAMQKIGQPAKNIPERQCNLSWPEGDNGPLKILPKEINADNLYRAIDAAFNETLPDKPRKTYAVLIVYMGQLILERYAPGFDKDMPLLGWSISKSITNALVGILVGKGKLSVKEAAPVPEWQASNDPRKKITLDQLLRMSSGLEFNETYQPLFDVTEMLYNSYDFAAFAAQKHLQNEPDTNWSYSSGTTNIIARIIRHTVEKEYNNYYDFIRNELLYKIGMYSAVMEPDPAGTFVGSSYTFATPRDWARFGLLYLDDGVWKGERILPEGWVRYSSAATPKAPLGEYGAHFWTNTGSPADKQKRPWPNAPLDTFAASGFQEQLIIIVPSKKIVMVRFGATSYEKAWNTDEFISNVLASLP